VYVLWEKGQNSPREYRLATKRGTQWTFEDILTPVSTLAADPSGTAWISDGTGLYQHALGDKWNPVAVPCGVNVASFVIDDAGAIYIADGNRVWRRDPLGAWGFETALGEVQQLYLGGGTVHYTRTSDNDVYYGRRIGTTWSEQLVFVHPKNTSISDYRMALDTCGAPHFEVTVGDAFYQWTFSYIRWTAQGWRRADWGTIPHPMNVTLGIATDNAHFISFVGSATVPLR